MTTDPLLHVPEPSLRRLPFYHQLLKRLQARGREVVSTTHIAQELKLDPTQVRKDLAVTGIVGKPRTGYAVSELLESIEGFLGWNNATEAFLVGAGNLGGALLGYQRFNQYGLKIVAAFDSDPAKVGTVLHDHLILPLEKLVELATRMHIHLGIITVPGEAAQAVARLMVEGGIKAIWNFAPIPLDVPENVIVEDENLASTLAVLSSKLSRALKPAGSSNDDDVLASVPVGVGDLSQSRWAKV